MRNRLLNADDLLPHARAWTWSEVSLLLIARFSSRQRYPLVTAIGRPRNSLIRSSIAAVALALCTNSQGKSLVRPNRKAVSDRVNSA